MLGLGLGVGVGVGLGVGLGLGLVRQCLLQVPQFRRGLLHVSQLWCGLLQMPG